MTSSHPHLKMNNISFIGMAGCGKSTLGLALAKKLDLSFIDTDNLIEKKFEMSLEGVKNKFGYQFVRLAEEEVILSIDKSTKMISTGGSAVYSETSMNHLKSFSKISTLIFSSNTGYTQTLAKLVCLLAPESKGEILTSR